ncbi:MAG: FG-GAP repeat domain-containing protein, partial [Planctomycetaceae bacterium]
MSKSLVRQRSSRRTCVTALLLAAGMIGTAAGWFWFQSRPVPSTDQERVPTAPDAPPLFTDVTAEAGIEFLHVTGRRGRYFFPDVMAPGGAMLDFDLDGDLDILLINSGSPKAAADDHGSNRLYRQEPGGRFADVTEGSGLEGGDYGMGVAVGDVNNDGRPDVYVTNYGPDRLYLNQADGTFLDITEAAGIDNPQWGASACFVDYDRDGRLDLMVTNYVDYYPSRQCVDGRGREDFCGPQVFFGTADKLYRNESGSGTTVRFTDVSLSSGIAHQRGPGLSVTAADFNGDRWPDIYVANDGAANFLWINQRDGTFRDEAVLQGVANDALGRAQAGMGIAVGDVNGDAAFDLFVTHLAGETNTLYLSDAAGFRDAGPSAGLAGPSFPYTGFGTALADLDHDGDLDALVVNGRVKRPESASAGDEADTNFWRSYAEPNQISLNDGDGRFEEFSSSADPFTSAVDASRGLAAGDIDNDGDLDVLVT